MVRFAVFLLVLRLVQKCWNWLTPDGWWQITNYWYFAGTVVCVLAIYHMTHSEE
jgi:hypothetical protein